MDVQLLTTTSMERRVGDVGHGSKALRPTLTAGEPTLLGAGILVDTLRAFVVASASVRRMRQGRPDTVRPFCVPFGPVFRNLGIVSGLDLMLSLPVLIRVPCLVGLNVGFGLRFLSGFVAVSPAGVGMTHPWGER